jgi:hypothetical protein
VIGTSLHVRAHVVLTSAAVCSFPQHCCDFLERSVRLPDLMLMQRAPINPPNPFWARELTYFEADHDRASQSHTLRLVSTRVDNPAGNDMRRDPQC